MNLKNKSNVEIVELTIFFLVFEGFYNYKFFPPTAD